MKPDQPTHFAAPSLLAKLHNLTKDQQWWLGLSLILIPAAVLRFTGFTFGLPYFDHMDEPWLFYEAAYQRGLLTDWLHPNPSPGLLTMFKVGQMIAEAFTHQTALAHVPEIVMVMRFVSVLASLLTLVFIGLCARELAGTKAGWLAAATWAVIAYVIYHSFIAIAEPWMMLFGALTLWMAVAAYQRKNPQSAVWSVLAGLMAFAFKYSMFPFVGIGVAVALWQGWAQRDQQTERRRWLKALGIQALIITAFLLMLVIAAGLLTDVTNPGREVAVFLKSPLARLTDWPMISRIVNAGFEQFGMTPILWGSLILLALWVVGRKRSGDKPSLLPMWLLMAALGIFSMALIPLYLLTDATIARYTFAADLIFVILGASAFVVLYDYVRMLGFMRKRQIIPAILLIAIVAIWLGPLAVTSIQEAYLRTKRYTFSDMTVWASNTLGEGNIITEGLGNRAFNREFGGYTGPKRTANDQVNVMSKSPDLWRQEGYQYTELAGEYEQKVRESSEGTAYLNQLLELRRFPPVESKDAYTGPSFVVYALKRPETALDITFQDTFKLIGCDGMPSMAHVGDTLTMRFYWQAIHKPSANVALLIHLQPVDSDQLVAQADGAPGPLSRPTTTWDVMSETLMSEPLTLRLPETLAPGQYRLFIGLYDVANGQRLTTTQQGMTVDRVLFATMTIAGR